MSRSYISLPSWAVSSRGRRGSATPPSPCALVGVSVSLIRSPLVNISPPFTFYCFTVAVGNGTSDRSRNSVAESAKVTNRSHYWWAMTTARASVVMGVFGYTGRYIPSRRCRCLDSGLTDTARQVAPAADPRSQAMLEGLRRGPRCGLAGRGSRAGGRCRWGRPACGQGS